MYGFIANGNGKGCMMALCHLRTLPGKLSSAVWNNRFNFQGVWACCCSKHFRSKHPHGGAVSLLTAASLCIQCLLLGHLTRANLCAFQITLVPSLTSICWFHFWGKKMQETSASSRFLQNWNIRITLWLVVELPPDTYMPWPTTLWKW